MRNPFSGRLGHRATRSVVAALAGALGLAVTLASLAPALSQSADCDRLRQAISDASHNAQGAQYQAAAERQRGELDRTVAYAHSIGCENKKFLFFGSEPPAQCGQLNAQIGRMRANLNDLQARAGGGRGELVARYNAQCANQPARAPSILDALFGQPKSNDPSYDPLSPDAPVTENLANGLGEARAGAKAVCVRSCDGSFFPVSYSANGGRLDGLQDMCRALCPNADVTLYTYPSSGDIEQAVSITGARYMDSPTALKFRQTFDSTCSCRRRGQTWADALAGAEAKLGREDKSDIIVTPEKSLEMSRPKSDPKADGKLDPKGRLAKANGKPAPGADAKAVPGADAKPAPGVEAKAALGTDANGVDTTLSQQAATISRETSGIAGGAPQSGAPVGKDQGQSVDVTGPDGVKRKVRIVGPTF
jgi:hypothetical protein